MRTFSFENLDTFKMARGLVKDIYSVAWKFPAEERYGLTSQIQRAAISIPSNIAEGSGRCSNKEKIHFIEISFGSLMEVYCQLTLALDLEYITNDDFNEIKPHIFELSRLLSSLKKSFTDKLTLNP
ncbi:MAG: four helix bundle protein [Bacteroides sp.]|nr:four helix bundle protein [Bacteroides sp.]MCM1379277.1 four helix bundle protein [Bacteroides sp.]MCM1445065.1 four helix bundle protein [Prevotella sp.]